MTCTMIFLHTTIVMLFVLALRIKLWEKSVTTFYMISMMIIILVLSQVLSHTAFIATYPVFIAISMLMMTARAVLKNNNDSFMGDLKWDRL